MEHHRLAPAGFCVAVLAMVGVFVLFPQLKPDWITIHVGNDRPGHRGFHARQTSWTRPPTPAEARLDRGLLHLDNQEWDQAISDFTEVVRLDPKNADAYYARGLARHHLQKLDEAIADYDATLRLRPRNALALLSRGKARFDLDQDDLALADVEASIRLQPSNEEALCIRGKIREVAGEYRLAVADYQQAAQLAPNDPQVLNYLAWLLATAPDAALRDGRCALEAALRAVEIEKHEQWDTIDTLAAAYAENGRFAEAVKTQTEALRLAPSEEHSELRARLELYQAPRPYRLTNESH